MISIHKILLLVLISVSFLCPQKNEDMISIKGGFYSPLYKGGEGEIKLKVEPFLLDKHQVTNEQFLAFVKEKSEWRRSNVKKLFADETYLKHWKDDIELGAEVNPDAPVVFVSWFAAKAYAKWKGKRLPTVAEWELAGLGYSPSEMKIIRDWYSGKKEKPSSVGVRKNKNGLYDMFGQVWEWVSDFNGAMVSGDSRGDVTMENNLFCGSGSTNSKDAANYPAFIRYGFRSSLKANYTVHNLGFRCAKDITKINEARK
jgi:formylglycine-generating enzyme